MTLPGVDEDEVERPFEVGKRVECGSHAYLDLVCETSRGEALPGDLGVPRSSSRDTNVPSGGKARASQMVL